MSIRKSAPCPRAFTLVELLAVIAVICLLLSILLPALTNVSGTARRVPCLNNLRLIGQGIHGYVAANTQYLPPDGVTLLPGDDINWTSTPPILVRRHPWSPGWLFWNWADFIQPYFDTEAKPVTLGWCTIARQPSDDVYNRWTSCGPANFWGPPVIFSRRMNCPAQPNANSFEYGMEGCRSLVSWYLGPSCEQFYKNVGGTWVADHRTISPDVPDADPAWMGNPYPKIGDHKVDKYAVVVEPGACNMGADFEFQDIGTLSPQYWGFLWYTYGAPHINNTTNVLYLDGHAGTFTRDYLRSVFAKGYPPGLPFWDY